ncbi:hypothetical protein GH714_010621 [Hevea brasiliensis]|uniref:Ion transport domain-containing protein n=1 Tax=Hevea brasiliensis TaxID=3981 RepID=A0A6A6MT72_HEVBR|nr:hypothetical protein GH714_010621 [Hevea brasiliensis]
MFEGGYKSQYLGGQREKFVRLDDLDSRLSSSSDTGVKKCGFGISHSGQGTNTTSRSFKKGIRKGSEGLKSIVSVDPLFFYLPVFNDSSHCLEIDRKLAITATTLRTIIDAFYLIRMALQFRTAYIAPSSRVFGRGELVIDPARIAKRYLRQYFFIDFLSVVPLPQIMVWRFLQRSKGSDVLATKQALLLIILLQYIPRFLRIIPLTSEMKRTTGVFAETAWAGAAYYLLLYMLASHDFLYCGNQHMDGYTAWSNISDDVLKSQCAAEEDGPFDYGIYTNALSSGIASSKKFISKYCYCLWWGLQNLSTLGQGLQTSTYPLEVIFSIALAILGLILFALLIGNMQTYLQSLTIRLEEMRVKRRDSEQWMHHRLLPQDLRERVRRYDQYKWLETRGVDEETLVQSLPKDLRRDIKRHLCLALVRRVPLFENMDERLLDAIYGGRSGFFNRSMLKEGAFCGEELLTWALDPKSGANLPSSTRTVKAITEVEAFALIAEELKFVASQFRRLHSRQVQHTFRFYSQQWRTWAACFIQAAWRRYSKRKNMELRKKEEEAEADEAQSNASGGSYSIGATFLATRFAANALRGVHRNRNAKTARELVKLQKPPEPDFSVEDAD